MDHVRADARVVLERWLREHPRHLAEIREVGRADHHLSRIRRSPTGGYTALERLYALGRLLDLLLLNHQERPEDRLLGDRTDAHFPARGVYEWFCDALGADPIGGRPFHPFFHEIVEVQQAEDADEQPSIVAELWPGHLMDRMLLVRAGVVVRAGSAWLVRGVADRSVLYWTHWRRARRTDDLATGWGSNSQWATDFRRDYLVDGQLHYNVDEALREPTGRPFVDDLDPAAMTEIVRHRCLTVVDHGDDLFPYDHHHTEPAPTLL